MPKPKIIWSGPSENHLRTGTQLGRQFESYIEVPKDFISDDLPTTLPNPIFSLLNEIGTPEVVGANSPKEDAIGLLMLAAEIEHALMIQYLYATASLNIDDTSNEGPSRKLASIAVQEMGHLISVQNLLLLVGGPDAFHFGRDLIREGSTENPIPLVLEPISKLSLARYIGAEMPAEISDPELNKKVKSLISELGTEHPNRVGAIYAKLFWLFQPDDNPKPPLNLFSNEDWGLKPGWHLKEKDYVNHDLIEQFQATRDEWLKGSVRKFILNPVSNYESALKLIGEISEQGEGLIDRHESHFSEFIELWEMFERNELSIAPLPIVKLPVTHDPVFEDDASKYIQLYSSLMDIRYNLLVLDFWWAISIPRSTKVRNRLIQFGYDNMFFLRDISTHILKLKIDYVSSGPAPSYTLFFEDIPQSEEQRLARCRELLEKQRSIVANISTSDFFQDCTQQPCEILDFDGSILIENLATNDAGRSALFPNLV